jgi:hypothetical protein
MVGLPVAPELPPLIVCPTLDVVICKAGDKDLLENYDINTIVLEFKAITLEKQA